MIFSYISLDTLYLIESPVLLILRKLFYFVLVQQKFLYMHSAMEKDLTNYFGCLGFQGICVASEGGQILMKNNLPINELDLIH